MSARPRLTRRRVLGLGLALTGAALSGNACGSTPLLGEVELDRDRLAPDGRDPDAIVLGYRLHHPARVRVYIRTAELPPPGASAVPPPRVVAVLRDWTERQPGSYQLHFDGAVPAGSGDPPGLSAAAKEPGVLRQTLPAGRYELAVEATTGPGEAWALETVAFSVERPDRTVPRIEGLRVSPDHISPNDPDLPDTATLTYTLAKAATVQIQAEGPGGARRVVLPPTRQAAGEQRVRWSVSPFERRTPDGAYTLVVEARDTAGNVTEARAPVELTGTERPMGSILGVEFGPTRVAYGDTVRVRITVRNTGRVPLRTHGPPPGYRYTTRDTFASVEAGRYLARPRCWRVGVDWAGGLGPEGARYPYRWSLGRDLAPGEETVVEGEIQILERWDRIWLYAGLIQEGVSYYVDKVGQQLIEIEQP